MVLGASGPATAQQVLQVERCSEHVEADNWGLPGVWSAVQQSISELGKVRRAREKMAMTMVMIVMMVM
eukprot:861845-Karenia_brevis.AAC.1